ncbi:hypothetical protein BGX28_006286 [Mortierella sp. GBA30]|nr:hypothetical protein BGX28_006286 [Mortierella sp. GBA30]
MNQSILQGALPILANILGEDAAAGVMAVLNMTITAIASTVSAIEQGQRHFGQGKEGSQYQSAAMSALVALVSNINSAFASLTASETPLTTYILLAVLSYVVFRIVYGIVSWIVRSVLNLIKLSIMIAVVTAVLWFIINITSEGNDASSSYSANRQYSRHRDPISQGFNNMQTKFRAEYHRQQQYVHNAR